MTEKNRPVTERLLDWVDHRRWLVLGLVLAIYLAAFNGQWRPGADSAESLLIAQKLIDGHPYAHHLGWYIPVGLPCLLAVLGSVTGGQINFVLVQAVMLGVALAGLAVAFVLLRHCFGRPTAVMLTATLALTETYFRLAFDLLTDIPFELGLMVMLLGWAWVENTGNAGKQESRKSKAIAGWGLLVVGVVVMTLFRSVAVSVLVGVGLTVAWRLARGPARWKTAAMGAVCMGAWVVTRYAAELVSGRVNSDEQVVTERLFHELPQTLWRLVTYNAPRLATENTAEALFAVDLGPIVSVGLIVVIALTWLRLVRVNVLWALLVVAFFAQWLLFLPGDRYFLPILLPLLVGWWESAKWLEKRWPGAGTGAAAIAMVVLWVVPNLVFVGHFIVEQRRTPYLEQFDRGRFVWLRTLAELLRDRTEADALIVSMDGAVLSWYSGRTVIDQKQLLAEVDDFGLDRAMKRLREGAHLYVVRSPELKMKTLRRNLGIKLTQKLLSEQLEGDQPWVLYRATVLPVDGSAVESDQPDEQDDEQADTESK